jgi:hypothetical protein
MHNNFMGVDESQTETRVRRTACPATADRFSPSCAVLALLEMFLTQSLAWNDHEQAPLHLICAFDRACVSLLGVV